MDEKPALTRWRVPPDDLSWHMAKGVGSDTCLRRLLAPFYETAGTCSPSGRSSLRGADPDSLMAARYHRRGSSVRKTLKFAPGISHPLLRLYGLLRAWNCSERFSLVRNVHSVPNGL